MKKKLYPLVLGIFFYLNDINHKIEKPIKTKRDVDTSKKINNSLNLDVENDPGATNRHIIPTPDNKRLIYDYMPQWNERPDYFITNFRTKNIFE